MRFFVFPAAFIFMAFWLNSCKPPDGGIPFYLAMDSVVLSTTYATQGDNTQDISNLWVQSTSTNLGAYGLPCNFPVLQEGNVSFLVSAGVWESGQTEMPIVYPFFQPDTFTILNAIPGHKYSHIPRFTYKAGTIFAFYPPNPPTEDFEGHFDYNDSMQWLCHDTNVKYGNCCGVISVTPEDSDVVATQESSQAFTLNTGQEAWLEFDYKCSVPFWVGLNSNFYTEPTDQEEIILITPKPYWSKIYISMTYLVAQEAADNYTLYFEALNPTGNTGGGKVYLDDIKVVHF